MTMNSVTTTMMRRPTPLGPISLKPQAAWANPAESIDSTVAASLETQRGRFGQPVEHYFWAVKGPALTAYSSIEGKIQDCLSCRDDLFEGEAESALPNSIDCFMVGRTPEKACPCIAVSCESKNFCRKVIAIVKGTSWWFEFYSKHPGFKFVHLRNRPRPIRKALHHEDGPLVYTQQPLLGSGTIPLFFFKSGPLVDGNPRLPDSTMGGIIHLDGEPFGLTVAHALHPTPTTSDSYTLDDSDRSSTFSFIDESDDDYICYSDTMPAELDNTESSNAAPCTENPETSSSISTKSKHSHLIPFEVLGRVVQASEGSPSDEVDWALIAFDQDLWVARDTTSLTTGLQPEPRQKTRGTINNLERVKTVPDSTSLACAKPVSIQSSGGDTVSGMLKATRTLVGLNGSSRLLNLHTVLLDRAVLSGECGLWVVDIEGNWYGHVVAAERGSSIAYVAPAHKIIRAIEITTGKRATAVEVFTRAPQASPSVSNEGDTSEQTIDQQASMGLIDEFGDREDKMPSQDPTMPTKRDPIASIPAGGSVSEPSSQIQNSTESRTEPSRQQRFFRYIRNEMVALQEQIDRILNSALSKEDRSDAIDHCFAGINRLSVEVNDDKNYLPLDELGTFNEAIGILETKLESTRKALTKAGNGPLASRRHSVSSPSDAKELVDGSFNADRVPWHDDEIAPPPKSDNSGKSLPLKHGTREDEPDCEGEVISTPNVEDDAQEKGKSIASPVYADLDSIPEAPDVKFEPTEANYRPEGIFPERFYPFEAIRRRSLAEEPDQRKQLRLIPCLFHRYGCMDKCVERGDWQLHAEAHHLRVGVYRCDVGACANSPGESDFRRMYHFDQHCRMAHGLGPQLETDLPAGQPRRQWYLERDIMRIRCWMVLSKRPSEVHCGFCGERFVDSTDCSGWDKGMEHIWEHYENGASAYDEADDGHLRSWALSEGIIRAGRKEGQFWLVGYEPGGAKEGERIRWPEFQGAVLPTGYPRDTKQGFIPTNAVSKVEVDDLPVGGSSADVYQQNPAQVALKALMGTELLDVDSAHAAHAQKRADFDKQVIDQEQKRDIDNDDELRVQRTYPDHHQDAQTEVDQYSSASDMENSLWEHTSPNNKSRGVARGNYNKPSSKPTTGYIGEWFAEHSRRQDDVDLPQIPGKTSRSTAPAIKKNIAQRQGEILRACERCKARKTRCDSTTTNTWPCEACIRANQECIPPLGLGNRLQRKTDTSRSPASGVKGPARKHDMNLNLRACTACRLRKVRCRSATANTWPCEACTALDIPCKPPVDLYTPAQRPGTGHNDHITSDNRDAENAVSFPANNEELTDCNK